MAISWSDVEAVAPELASVPTATQTKILAVVENWVDVDAWGAGADDGKTYLAAHLASLRNNTGLISEETLGPMSRSYAVPPGIRGSWALSTYGAVYLTLLQTWVGPGAIVP